MQSRAIVGLLGLSAAVSAAAWAHGPGVTHTYENGQPIITVRLVPDEAAMPKAKRLDALSEQPLHAEPSGEPSPQDALNAPPETVEPAAAGETFDPPLNAEPANELPSGAAATGSSAAATRYPNAQPIPKPNAETGVGGALDLAPPAQDNAAQPRPMRLNAVQRQRNVAERAPRPQPREQRVRQPRPTETAARPSQPDPLDEALPSRVIMAPAPAQAMELPPVKTDERIAVGN